MERRSAMGPCIDITVDDSLPAFKDVAAVIANSKEFQVLMSANRIYGLRLASAHQTKPRAAIEHNNSTAIVSGGTKVGALSSCTPLATFDNKQSRCCNTSIRKVYRKLWTVCITLSMHQSCEVSKIAHDLDHSPFNLGPEC